MQYRSAIIMEVQKVYEIFTDASYDDVTKVGTYAIVIMQENKVVKIIAKKCNVQLENSTECEVFAIFQAINLIQGSLLKKNMIQKFWLRTDCVVARDFFIEDKNKVKVFESNLTLSNKLMKESNKHYLKKIVVLGLGGYLEKVIRLLTNIRIWHLKDSRRKTIKMILF